MKVLVNTITTKKVTGGAFQIAYNFMCETLNIASSEGIEWLYVVSQDLDKAIGDQFADLRDVRYFVFPTQPDFRGTYKATKKALRDLERRLKPDLVYTITSPSYFRFEAVEVMRYTNPWVSHPNRYAWKSLPVRSRIKTWVYCLNQKLLIKKNKYFITQSHQTKEGIMRVTGRDASNIAVVSNVLPATIASYDNQRYDKDSDWIDIACVGTPMSHKNLIIVPDVIKVLERKYSVRNVRFHVTMRTEYKVSKRVLERIKENEVEDRVVNHGQIPQKELVEVYKHCQYCFIPTLLEVFSATSLEAMYFGLPIVATDFPFNRDVIGDAGLYCRPADAEDAADKLYTLINNPSLVEEYVKKEREQLKKFGNHENHFQSIVEFLFIVYKKEYGNH